ncbi:MAG: hypothetical protein E5W82_10520 [Mesorhizobium sp.]|nr:MAG: hypothetical protein E5W82_10520 [Mesorhizobium sp.]
MADAPLCRYCGKTIAKRTRAIFFGELATRQGFDTIFTYRPERPRSKDEAQRLLNQQIVSVRWARGEDYAAKQAGFDHITQATAWDGESYTDKFFCNGTHAKDFAYAAARGGYAMPAYIDAKRKKGG